MKSGNRKVVTIVKKTEEKNTSEITEVEETRKYTNYEDIEARIEEIQRKRNEEIKKITERLMLEQRKLNAAEYEMERTDNNIDLLDEYNKAKQAAISASETISKLNKWIDDAKKHAKPMVSAEETGNVMAFIQSDSKEKVVRETQRAIALMREVYEIAKAAYEDDTKKEVICRRWMHEVNPHSHINEYADFLHFPMRLKSIYTATAKSLIYNPNAVVSFDKADMIEKELNDMV